MIICPFLKNKTVYVVGLGKTGSASISSLISSNAKVLAWDDNNENTLQAKNLFPDIEICSPSGLANRPIDYILMSPGIANNHESFAVASTNNIEIISDIDLLYLACPDATYVAITGTNGKSTTTALIGHILKSANKKVQIGGNIGTAVLSLEPLDSAGIYVLELSSFQLDLLHKAKFNLSVMLNLTPDHLDRHGSLDEYFRAKVKVFNGHSINDQAIISRDYPEIIKLEKTLGSNLTTFSIKNNADITMHERNLTDSINNVILDFSDLTNLLGRHNEENIAAAYATCIRLSIKFGDIEQGIRSFQGLPHRMQVVRHINGSTFVNDSKATNAEAAEKALVCYKDIIWILGGVAKAGGISGLEEHLWRIKKAYLIGEAQDEFSKTLDLGNCQYEKCNTLENALKAIKKSHLTGVVLLSPACASYDQFKNFEHRGEEFCRLVEDIFINH